MMSSVKWVRTSKRRCPPTPPPHGRRALHFRRPDASCAIPPRVAHGRPPSALPVSGSAAATAESEEGFDRSSRISSQTGTPPRVVLAIDARWASLREFSCCSRTSSTVVPFSAHLVRDCLISRQVPPGMGWWCETGSVVVCFFSIRETPSLCQNLSWVEVAGIRPGPGFR